MDHTLATFESNKMSLMWAKENLNKDIYIKIEKSYEDIIKYTVIVMVVLILIYFIVVLTQVSTMDKYSSDSTRTAHVYKDKIWYIQNDKKEINLSDYGYNYKDYSENEQFIVYLDKDYNVINISPLKDVQNEKHSPAIIMVLGLVLIIIIILCIYVPICYNTFGRNWRKFCKWYNNGNLNQEKFEL